MSPEYNSNVVCPHCGTLVAVGPAQAGESASCVNCGGKFQIPLPVAQTAISPYVGMDARTMEIRLYGTKKVIAGICGLFFGGMGIHKFVLGLNSAGIIMLSVWLISLATGFCLIVPWLLIVLLNILGFIEGILYLVKSDEEFYQIYAIEKRQWF